MRHEKGLGRRPSKPTRSYMTMVMGSDPPIVLAPIGEMRRLLAGQPSLRHGHQLEEMAIGHPEVDAASTAPVVEFAVACAPGGASVGKPGLANAAENGVELGVGDVERVVVAFEVGVVVEQEGQRAVDLHRREVLAEALIGKAEELGELAGGSLLVARRHNGV